MTGEIDGSLSAARGGIDDRPDFGNPAGGETALAGVFPHGLLVHGDIEAIHPVVSDVTLDPLHPGAEFLEDITGLAGSLAQLVGREFSHLGNVAFDNIFWHRIDK